jgi:hypothetical protein
LQRTILIALLLLTSCASDKTTPTNAPAGGVTPAAAPTVAKPPQPSPSPTADTTKAVETPVREFYQWYVDAMVKGDKSNPPETPMANIQAEKSNFLKYITKAFYQQVANQEGFDADPFIQAQDYDAAWGKKIQFDRTEINGDKATSNISLGPGESMPEPNKLRITLKQEDGKWKIDKVDSL